MDGYEATKIVFSRIQNMDPENASKIMGLLLIQDHGEKEIIRLAMGPESLVHSVILKAKKELNLSTNSPGTPSTPSSPSPFNNHLSLSRQSSNSSRLLGGLNLPSPLSIRNQSCSSPSSWATSSFSQNNRSTNGNAINSLTAGSSSSSMNASASPFYASGEPDLIDEFHLQDQLSFLNDGSPPLGSKNLDLFYPQTDLASSPADGDAVVFPSYCGSWGGSTDGLHHRRSCSVSDICLGSDDPSGGFGWKPCLYFARGYCKNGTTCRFLHGETDGSASGGSPSKFEMMEQCQELMRSKSGHQQKPSEASQLMGSPNFRYSAVTTKSMNFLLQQQLQADGPRSASALMMGEEMNKFGRSRIDRNEFVNGGPGMMNPGSRQIYLTFPADSTFREDDVSNYFSIYGPVQDVRIPYQQQRMFGFVTFVFPETVKLILAKGNPHFVCDARVLVKPYKEKGKVPDKFRKQQQLHVDRGDFSACSSPTGLESRDPFDLQLGVRSFYNSQDMLWRRKLEEQADFQQALELQSRRLMGLQLLDVKRRNHHSALSTGAAIPYSPSFFNQTVLPSDRTSPKVMEDHLFPHTVHMTQKERESANVDNGNGNGKQRRHENEKDSKESLEHNYLPDSPFESPKARGGYLEASSNHSGDVKKFAVDPTASHNLITSSLDMASLKSCYFQAPRLSSGHGTIGM